MILVNKLLANKSLNTASLKAAAPALLRRIRASRNARLPLIVIGAAALVALLGFLYLKRPGYRLPPAKRDPRLPARTEGNRRTLGSRGSARAVEGASGKPLTIGDRGTRVPDLLRRMKSAAAEIDSPVLAQGCRRWSKHLSRKPTCWARYRAAGRDRHPVAGEHG